MKLLYKLNPYIFGAEMLYSLAIAIFCIAIFFITKEIYSLTKHKGIKYFRLAFLGLSAAYIARLLVHMGILNYLLVDQSQFNLNLISVMVTIGSFFSILGILYLGYSLFWRKISEEKFTVISLFIASATSLVAFIIKEIELIFLIELLILLGIIIYILVLCINEGRKLKNKTIYLLIISFLLFDLLSMNQSFPLPYYLILCVEIVSILVFTIILHKVLKWVK